MIDEKFIKSLPLTTNKINVTFDKEKFFSKYAVVSYDGTNKNKKNLAYEHLADCPFLSVTGIWARWNNNRSTVRFFVLVNKGGENKVLNSLRMYDYIRSKIDMLEDYDENLQKRIVASLAINSLGMKQDGEMMYNDGNLLVCDEKNFNIPKSRKELVCLKMEVNRYMNLTAKTVSFSCPRDAKELLKYQNCAFKIGRDVGGFMWEGRSVKPVSLNGSLEHCNLNELLVQKKRFSGKKNTVAYWPYDRENYTHGKLFVIWQVVNSVNENFKGILNIGFSDFPVWHYDQDATKKEMSATLKNFFSDKTIRIEDPFNTEGSKTFVEQMEEHARGIIDDSLSFTEKKGDDLTIRLCGPEEDDENYAKAAKREEYSGTALQHVIFDGNKKKASINEASVRRILMDLLVKDALNKREMPRQLSDMIQGWRFTEFKMERETVYGASLSVSENGKLEIQEQGLGGYLPGVDPFLFVHDQLGYDNIDIFHNSGDYKALIKNGNVYLIVDTDEIPILDAEAIDAGYDKVVNEGESLSMFKRRKTGDAHIYLRGYIGLHLWKTDGIDGEPEGSYSYIVGTHIDNVKIVDRAKMDKMPHARRIFVLCKEHPETIESDIMEIMEMLKCGLGRWNEMMTYPFPFKFLREYLDNASEKYFSKHWTEKF